MKTNTFIISFFTAVLSIMLFSCEKIDNLGKTDVEILHEYINSGDWQIDSIRSQSSGFFPIAYLDNYLPFTSGKVTFSKVSENQGFTKGIMTRIVKINNKDSTIKTPYLIAAVNYIKLYSPNANLGFPDIEIIYTIKERSKNKFTFIREETLVNPANGSAYGFARTVFKLKR